MHVLLDGGVWVQAHVESDFGAMLEHRRWRGGVGVRVRGLFADGDAGTEGIPRGPGRGVDKGLPDRVEGGGGCDGAGDVVDGVGGFEGGCRFHFGLMRLLSSTHICCEGGK